jgi:hypothetical protein
MNPSNYFFWDCPKDHVYHTNLHTVEIQVESEGVAEEITSDMLCDAVDNRMVLLQHVHWVRACHIECTFA